MFFDVRLDRDEVVVDEGRDIWVGVRLGLQPSARASSRGGTEINQQRFLRSLGFRQRGVGVFIPIDSHVVFPPELEVRVDSAAVF